MLYVSSLGLIPSISETLYPLTSFERLNSSSKRVTRTVKALRFYTTFKLTSKHFTASCLVAEGMLLLGQTQWPCLPTARHASGASGLYWLPLAPGAEVEIMHVVDLHSS